MTLSVAALRFLVWIRDNQHHVLNWIEAEGETYPDNWKHLRLSGHKASIKVHRDVIDETNYLFEPDPDYDNTKKIYRPNAAGLRALEEAAL